MRSLGTKSLAISTVVSFLCFVMQGMGESLSVSTSTAPVGRWKTVDDVTGKVNSIVVLWNEDGKLYGKIDKLVNPDPNDSDPRCARCPGLLKNQRLVGLRILWDLAKHSDEWAGGQILDPDTGKVYKCSITVQDGGKKLKVRGFIGFSVLGRTEYWLRDN